MHGEFGYHIWDTLQIIGCDNINLASVQIPV